MSEQDAKIIIGRAEAVTLPAVGLASLPARIDTGAKTSAIWASDVKLVDGKLHVVFLGVAHPAYTGQVFVFDDFSSAIVASSNGHAEQRYKVKLLIQLFGRSIRATFTLADRSSQVYPILIGRNVLRGKFLVDVKKGEPLTKQERIRTRSLQSRLKDK